MTAASTRARMRMMAHELRASRDTTRGLWDRIMMMVVQMVLVVMMVEKDLLLSVRFPTSTLILSHIREVACITITTTVICVT